MPKKTKNRGGRPKGGAGGGPPMKHVVSFRVTAAQLRMIRSAVKRKKAVDMASFAKKLVLDAAAK
jgi:hypothetical protein